MVIKQDKTINAIHVNEKSINYIYCGEKQVWPNLATLEFSVPNWSYGTYGTISIDGNGHIINEGGVVTVRLDYGEHSVVGSFYPNGVLEQFVFYISIINGTPVINDTTSVRVIRDRDEEEKFWNMYIYPEFGVD